MLGKLNPKENQPWIFIGSTDIEAEAPILWPPGVKSQLTGKDPWCWERLKAGGEGGWQKMKWMASPIQWTWVWTNYGRWWRTGKSGSPWGCKELNVTEQLNNNKGKLNRQSCLGLRDKAEQASALASNLSGHCPDWECPDCLLWVQALLHHRWERGWILRFLSPWRGSGQLSPRLSNIPSFTWQN